MVNYPEARKSCKFNDQVTLSGKIRAFVSFVIDFSIAGKFPHFSKRCFEISRWWPDTIWSGCFFATDTLLMQFAIGMSKLWTGFWLLHRKVSAAQWTTQSEFKFRSMS